MRTLYFTQVTDDRFKGDIPILETLQNRSADIHKKLIEAGCNVSTSSIRKLDWPPPENNTQYRQDFKVTKPKGLTWDNLYELVNAVKPTYYSFKPN